MFRFLCYNNIFQRRKLLNDNFLQYPKFVRFLSSSHIDCNHFTVSYLVNSCGLSQEQAISASEKIQLTTTAQPDSVLTLFKNHEFHNTQISNIIRRIPHLLLSNVDKTLAPKFEYFNSIGLSGPDLAKVVALDPAILRRDLENQIIPAVAFLKSILNTDDKVIEMLKGSVSILRTNLNNNLVPNIQLLLAHGVPIANVSWLILYQPASLTKTLDHFKKVVEEVEEMNFDPLQRTFVSAVDAWSFVSTSTKEAKFNVYKQWGWSEVHILAAFKRNPNILKFSQRNVMQKMEFLVNKMGYDPLVMAESSNTLCYSLEKKIIPRCLVMKHLISNGLLKRDYSLLTVLLLNQQHFLERFVTKFDINVADLLDAFKEKMGG